MPLDHYVSQVHLKNFYSPKLGSLMYAIRKGDLKTFTPNAESVCRTEDGSTNSYLQEEREIEEFLKRIEPKYNVALAKLAADKIDVESIYVIAGFIAYIHACSPAGMRIQSELVHGNVEEIVRSIDSKGLFPAPPQEVGGRCVTELMLKGVLSWDIDPKYPEAMGITSIQHHTTMLGNFEWDILLNPFENSPFFTSDFPLAIEKTVNPHILNKIVPLSPNIAIRIRPDLSIDRNRADFLFPNFRRNIRKLNRSEVMYINRLITRCAETSVYFRDNHKWIQDFVKKNSGFRIEPKIQKIPFENRTILWVTQEVCEGLKDLSKNRNANGAT